MIDIAGFERDFTAWIATQLDMTVDTDIFRAAIPTGVAQGACVRVESEIPDYRIHFPRFDVQILFKGARDTLWQYVADLRNITPRYGIDISEDYKAVSIVPNGDAMPYQAADGGVLREFLSLHFFVQVVAKQQQEEQDNGESGQQ